MEIKRYERKGQPLSQLVDKIKLWPSRNGYLHGVKYLEVQDDRLIVTTHCGIQFETRNSRHSRAGRWLRNRFVASPCPKCKVPQWKLDKYGSTVFR